MVVAARLGERAHVRVAAVRTAASGEQRERRERRERERRERPRVRHPAFTLRDGLREELGGALDVGARRVEVGDDADPPRPRRVDEEPEAARGERDGLAASRTSAASTSTLTMFVSTRARSTCAPSMRAARSANALAAA